MKIFQGFSKKEKKLKKHEEIEFQNSIQYWVFTRFISCTKVLGKMPDKPLLITPVFESKAVIERLSVE